MKVICSWCLDIYTPLRPPKDDTTVFCSNGCRDADKLFHLWVLKEFEHLQDLRRKRLNRP
jgi:hypothetical protein